jgi:hypothetical protein
LFRDKKVVRCLCAFSSCAASSELRSKNNIGASLSRVFVLTSGTASLAIVMNNLLRLTWKWFKLVLLIIHFGKNVGSGTIDDKNVGSGECSQLFCTVIRTKFRLRFTRGFAPGCEFPTIVFLFELSDKRNLNLLGADGEYINGGWRMSTCHCGKRPH